ncbi:MAG: riboflavin synthase [Patescibacteria group bacterium]
MFSGLVGAMAKVISIKPKAGGFILGVECKKISAGIKSGSSVALNGVCLSVLKKTDRKIFFEVMSETIRKTTLGEIKVGDAVNLERSLRVGDELGGHFVFGHVDGVGEIVEIDNTDGNPLLTVEPLANLLEFFCPQGSVAMNGVSLTVARLGKRTFSVALIADTMAKTTLGKLTVGDSVNIECDMLAKYAVGRINN